MSVKQAKEDIDYPEFQEWYEFYLRNPWGEMRADWRAAHTSGILAEVYKAKGSTVDHSKFFYGRDEKDPEAVAGSIEGWAASMAAMNGVDLYGNYQGS